MTPSELTESDGLESSDLPADVIRVALAQLAREAVGFFDVASLAKCHCGFVQRARSDGGIVVKESDAFESFAV